ncbi:hypothetical protein [Flavobacterium saccharophilum]|uniref:AhpC/TSA family protein n=1 Tax=Flavobacterium saccharophilum TaxID=29534 RepID=A0A1M7HQZ7_9FLAO|nr:hypothetical protein [Flavobacterium saccharophilum]SHM30936.1 hypothetical protein SAMN05444366_2835 [Flavobacterium saccharophilum]
MSKFHLNIQELVQGEFVMNKVNIAFVFQVNCPGCFIYGIPIMNELYRSFKDKIGFIGVATAFEDFEYNNKANLKLLLNNGTLVGETKKYYTTNYGLSNYLDIPNFPTAFDRITSSEQFIDENKIELICNAIPNFINFSEKEKEILVTKVKQYYSQIPVIAETFTLNQLKGTPSFIIFDDKYNILEQYFGHQNGDILKTRLEYLLS